MSRGRWQRISLYYALFQIWILPFQRAHINMRRRTLTYNFRQRGKRKVNKSHFEWEVDRQRWWSALHELFPWDILMSGHRSRQGTKNSQLRCGSRCKEGSNAYICIRSLSMATHTARLLSNTGFTTTLQLSWIRSIIIECNALCVLVWW